jgi:Tfp pilus assembly protein PilF
MRESGSVSAGEVLVKAITLRQPARLVRFATAVRALALPFLLAAITFLVFLPALWNDFVEWDDQVNFLTNTQFRGLGWTNLKWMATTVLMGQWIPLSWLTLGLDYVVWGMNPRGYHLTNVTLHAINAALLFMVASRLLARTAGTTTAVRAPLAGAAAALFFAIHPLRAESVAWITERRDVLSGCFFLLAVLTYLVMVAAGASTRRRWLAISVAAYALAVMSKAIVVTLPAVLLILDVYPLRRLDPRPWTWFTPPARRVLLEKLPYGVLTLAGIGTAVYAMRANDFFTPLEKLPLVHRVPVGFYSIWFYFSTTVAPAGLSPLYELPAQVDLWQWRFVGSALGVLGVSAAVLVLRHQWPAGLVAWLAYLVMVSPVSGILHNGHQLAHDRYSYLACLPWALVFGGVTEAALHVSRGALVRPWVARAAAAAAVIWLIGLAVMTGHQVKVWRDTDSLWRYALESDPRCSICQANLGIFLFNRRLVDPAIERFQTALALRPDRVRVHGSWGITLLNAGRAHEAIEHFQLVLQKYPQDNDTRVNLAVALIQDRQAPRGEAELREILRRDPAHANAHSNLGSALVEQGRPAEALAHFRRAADLKPELAFAHAGLLRAHLALGDADAARREHDTLAKMAPRLAHQIGPLLVTGW